MKFFYAILFCLFSSYCFSQNNFIVKTEDGRRVLLKDNYTWEFIDAVPKQPNTPVSQPTTPQQPQIQNPPPAAAPYCSNGPNFKEPKLNTRVQAHLKKSRATMKDLKKKVAKDYTCTPAEVILLKVNETNAKGNYTFCVNGEKITYKRMGNSFFRKGKIL